MLVAFCIIFQARPVGTCLGAKFGRKPAKNQIQIIIFITCSEGKLSPWVSICKPSAARGAKPAMKVCTALAGAPSGVTSGLPAKV